MEADLDVAIESSGPLQGILTGKLLERSLGELLAAFPRIPFLSLMQADHPNSNFIGGSDEPYTYESLTRHLHFCQAFISLHPRQQVHDKGQTLLRLLVGKGRGIQEVRRLIGQVAQTDANVLILGESGTGKEVVARAIHELSARSSGPFVPINCGAIPAELLESELFGHEKGAFTGAIAARRGRFELAQGGTLFLDEIGDMPLLMQTRLLRVLEERAVVPVGAVEAQPVDLRLISASHRDLGELVAAGQFREDLYYRLNGLKLHLPALRERQDRAALLDQLLGEEARGAAVALAPAARQALLDYAWPGNVRQMRTVLRTLLALCEDDWIDLEDLPDEVRGAPQVLASVERVDDPLARAERDTLLRLLEAQCWHVSRVAAELGISRNTLYRKLQRHGIRRTRLSPVGVDEAVDKLSAAGASPDHP